ncbi:hypothetical protein DID75_04495 [Candidatus Marinamargulisbacteria bacterium SCGC AG-410-N11]|nr:hypothetical protein DID75_04495 [Candidatus Marinamargulisbacteria bacterium SCGC AG-410-N11]
MELSKLEALHRLEDLKNLLWSRIRLLDPKNLDPRIQFIKFQLKWPQSMLSSEESKGSLLAMGGGDSKIGRPSSSATVASSQNCQAMLGGGGSKSDRVSFSVGRELANSCMG